MPLPKHLRKYTLKEQISEKEISVLLQVSSTLVASLDLGVVLQSAIDSTVGLLHCDTGAIYLLNGDYLFLGATTPPLRLEDQWMQFHPEPLRDHQHLEGAITLRKPISLLDARTAALTPGERTVCEIRGLISILYIPLILEEKAIGALIIGTTSSARKFTDHEIDLCRTLSYQISLAVTNAQLYESVRQTNRELIYAYDAILLGWSQALELRDQDTQGHTARVTQMAVDLARKMGLCEAAITHLRRGALLHDIGKVAIPDAILKKNGPLTEEEWSIMRRHPEYAHRFLQQIDYLAPAMDIPYCHHEKWNGTGYPRGLKGDEIPIAARIFAVVDVFDALISDRPYRKALDTEQALQHIAQQSGEHFDPRVVSAFLDTVNAAGE